MSDGAGGGRTDGLAEGAPTPSPNLSCECPLSSRCLPGIHPVFLLSSSWPPDGGLEGCSPWPPPPPPAQASSWLRIQPPSPFQGQEVDSTDGPLSLIADSPGAQQRRLCPCGDGPGSCRYSASQAVGPVRHALHRWVESSGGGGGAWEVGAWGRGQICNTRPRGAPAELTPTSYPPPVPTPTPSSSPPPANLSCPAFLPCCCSRVLPGTGHQFPPSCDPVKSPPPQTSASMSRGLLQICLPSIPKDLRTCPIPPLRTNRSCVPFPGSAF